MEDIAVSHSICIEQLLRLQLKVCPWKVRTDTNATL